VKYNLERFTGNRRVVEIADGATKGATVGVDLFYNGVLVLWEDIYNGGPVTPSQPGTVITNWSLIADIPANIIALSSLAGTGIVVRTGDTTFALREITSVDGSVTITDPDGVGGNIDLSAGSGGGILPMVTGEIYAGQPRFMYFDDGSLMSVQVE
jgi:hypothetical protein